MFDINAKKQRNKQKKYYEIFLSPMHGGPQSARLSARGGWRGGWVQSLFGQGQNVLRVNEYGSSHSIQIKIEIAQLS